MIEACKFHKVRKIVMSSSPSTRFTGEDVDGLRESDMPQLPLESYMQEYVLCACVRVACITVVCFFCVFFFVGGGRPSLFIINCDV